MYKEAFRNLRRGGYAAKSTILKKSIIFLFFGALIAGSVGTTFTLYAIYKHKIMSASKATLEEELHHKEDLLEIFVEGMEKVSRQVSTRSYAKLLMNRYEQNQIDLKYLREQYATIFADARLNEHGFFIGRWAASSSRLYSSFEDIKLESLFLRQMTLLKTKRHFASYGGRVYLATKNEILDQENRKPIGFDLIAFDISEELKQVLNGNKNNITHDILSATPSGEYAGVFEGNVYAYLGTAEPSLLSGTKGVMSFEGFDVALSPLMNSNVFLLSRYNLEDRVEIATSSALEYLPVIIVVFLGLMLALLAFVLPLLRNVAHIDELNRTRDNFFSATSHDMRTPLNGLMGCIELLADEVKTENGKKLLKIIDNSGRFVIKIIDDLLDYSKISAGSMNLSLSVISTKTFFNNTVDTFSQMAKAKDISLTLVIEKSVPLAFQADPIRIEQVLINLIGNALKFTKEGSVALVVKSTPKGEDSDQLIVEVKDTGPGLSLAQIQDVFEPYVQVGRQVKEQFGGTGLGLSIAKELVSLHEEGNISVESKEGAGATFKISFVSKKVFLAQLDNQPNPTASLGRFKVLVVEDDPTNRFVLNKFLAKLGQKAQFAENGLEGVQMALAERYDLIFMDYKMPGMDGDQATKIIVDNLKDERPKIVALSASTMYEDRKAMADAGVDKYLSKPMKIQDIRRVFEMLPPPRIG